MTSSTTNYFKFTFVCCFVVFNEKKTYNLHIIVYMDLPPGIIPKKRAEIWSDQRNFQKHKWVKIEKPGFTV